jgi:hypothetical protein
MRGACGIYRKEERRIPVLFLAKPEGKRPLGRSGRVDRRKILK